MFISLFSNILIFFFTPSSCHLQRFWSFVNLTRVSICHQITLSMNNDILGKISQRILEGLREEIKQELDELPEETLKLLKEEIEDKLIEKKAEEIYIKLGLIHEDSLCKEESHKWK